MASFFPLWGVLLLSHQGMEKCSVQLTNMEINKCFITATYNNDNNGQRTFHFKCLPDTQQSILAPALAVWARQHYN